MGIKKPNIKYIPTDINGTINIQAPVNEVVKDEYNLSSDQKKATTDIVNRLYNVAERLANIDKALDEKLENYNIPYDPEQNPLLDEAVKCPYCGDEHAQSAINANSDKKKEKAQERINNYLACHLGLDGKTFDPVKISARQQKSWVDLLSQIITDLIKQIVSIVIDAINSILSLIPGVGGLLKSVSKKYRPNKKLSASNVYGDLFNDGISQDLVDVQRTNSDLEYDRKLFLECSNHISNYKKYAGILVKEAARNKKEDTNTDLTENWKAAKEANQIAKDSFKQLVNVADNMIPPNFKWEVNTENNTDALTQIKHYSKDKLLRTANITMNQADLMYDNFNAETNQLENGPKTQQSKANLMEFYQGLSDALSAFEDKYLKNVEDVLNEWWNDPNTICCLLRRLVEILEHNPDFFKWLKLIRAILNLYLALKYDVDFNIMLSRLSDIVKSLLKSLSTSIIGALSRICNLAFDAAAMKITDALGSIPAETCIPFDKLVAYLTLSSKNFKTNILALFNSFIHKEIDLIGKLDDINLANKEQIEIKGLLKIIDLLLNYALQLEYCKNYRNYVSPYAGRSNKFFEGSISDLNIKISSTDIVNKFSNNILGGSLKSDKIFLETNRSEILSDIYRQMRDLKLIDSKFDIKTKGKECACHDTLSKEVLDRLNNILNKN